MFPFSPQALEISEILDTCGSIYTHTFTSVFSQNISLPFSFCLHLAVHPLICPTTSCFSQDPKILSSFEAIGKTEADLEGCIICICSGTDLVNLNFMFMVAENPDTARVSAFSRLLPMTCLFNHYLIFFCSFQPFK